MQYLCKQTSVPKTHFTQFSACRKKWHLSIYLPLPPCFWHSMNQQHLLNGSESRLTSQMFCDSVIIIEINCIRSGGASVTGEDVLPEILPSHLEKMYK